MSPGYTTFGPLGLLAIFAVGLALIWLQKHRARRVARARLGEAWSRDERVDRDGWPYAVRERWEPDLDADASCYRVDDQTWFDLDLDAVVAAFDYTQTGVGAQALYRALRRPARSGEVGRRRVALARELEADADARTSCQQLLFDFHNQGWTLSAILWGPPLEAPIPVWLMRVLSVTPLLFAGAAYLGDSVVLVVLAIANLCGNIVLHTITNNNYRREMGAAIELGEMISLVARLRDVPVLASVFGGLDAQFERVAAVFGRKGVNASVLGGGSAAGREMTDYATSFFLLKVIALHVALRRIEQARPALQQLFDALGEVDLCIALAKLQNLRSLTPAQVGEASLSLSLVDATHPLLEDCVENDLRLTARGLVLTGSNMAGKSTFLRTVGLNVILAQSLGLVSCRRYEGPALRVYSSMNILDDLSAGHSRYRAEAERMLTLTRAAEGAPCLFLIDEMFAGTNPIERTAAAHAVARYLSESHPVLLATHDLELVEALAAEGFFAAYFSETAKDGDLRFDYRLRDGAAGRANAISILRALGFPEAVAADAERFAGELGDAARARR